MRTNNQIQCRHFLSTKSFLYLFEWIVDDNVLITLTFGLTFELFDSEVDGITYYGKVRDKCEGEDENTFDASGGLSSGRITAL